MALDAQTRHWLKAASQEGLEALRQRVEGLSRELAESRAEAARADSHRQEQIAELREQMETLSGDLRSVRAEVDHLRGDAAAQAERLERQGGDITARAEETAALQLRLEQTEAAAEAIRSQTEVIRTKVAGLTEQWRWDSEDLRKAVAALAERAEWPA